MKLYPFPRHQKKARAANRECANFFFMYPYSLAKILIIFCEYLRNYFDIPELYKYGRVNLPQIIVDLLFQIQVGKHGGSALAEQEFVPTVTATCKAGHMTIKVSTNQPFVGKSEFRKLLYAKCKEIYYDMEEIDTKERCWTRIVKYHLFSISMIIGKISD